MMQPVKLASRFNVWAIFALALLIRWGAFYFFYFVYKTPGGGILSPTADEVYELLARDMLGTRSLQMGFFAYRPPLLPMFIALVYIITGTHSPLAASLAYTFVSAAACLPAYAIAKELGAEEKWARMAALLTAIDPASVVGGVGLLAEAMANLFIAASFLFLARLLKKHQLRDAVACAASMVLASLARPNAIYFAIVVAALIVVFVPRWPVKAGVFLSVFVLGVLPWYVRNYAYHNLFTFATTSDFNQLFYKAVSVEAWATGRPPGDVQTDFAYELDRRLGVAGPRETYDYKSIWRHLVPSDPQAARIMREMAVSVYLAHPLTYIALIPVTLVKLLALSDPLKVFGSLKWFELAFNLGFYGLAAVGGFVFWKRRAWISLAITLLPIAYFLAVPVASGGIQDTRARTNVTVCFAIMAAEGIGDLWRRRHARE